MPGIDRTYARYSYVQVTVPPVWEDNRPLRFSWKGISVQAKVIGARKYLAGRP